MCAVEEEGSMDVTEDDVEDADGDDWGRDARPASS
jgi:hypothetical protein